MSVGIVCDSTCDLGLDYFESARVEMVPLKVQIGENTYLDWVEMKPSEFYEKHRSAPEMPITSQPSPADFAQAYAKLAAQGVEGIVAITLSAALSGTFQSASMAADEAEVPVNVVDSKLVSVATGLCVKAAVAERDAGGDLTSVTEAARWTSENCRLFFVLDTLEYLVKGGRAGKAAGLAASVLNIKPILKFNEEGIIEPFKKVKGLNKAFATLAEHVAAESAEQPMRASFMHAVAPDVLEDLKSAMVTAGARLEVDFVGEIGPVIGNYAGSGAVGLAYVPIR
ncbi:MAG: DegV family protein [Coriobacteriia bacterium]